MKNNMIAICLMFISLTATASTKMTYDYMAIDLLNTVRDCSKEYLAATQNGRVVLSAEGNFESSADQAEYTYTITIGRRLSAPSFSEVPMSKLVISRKALKANQNNAPDAPTKWEKTECQSFAIPK
jgi:hypothetical protein